MALATPNDHRGFHLDLDKYALFKKSFLLGFQEMRQNNFKLAKFLIDQLMQASNIFRNKHQKEHHF